MRFDGEKLRDLRKSRSWDQHRLASEARRYATGITQASVSRHENGMQPTSRNAAAYARALSVHVMELYVLDDAGQSTVSSQPISRDTATSLGYAMANALAEMRA